jgi:hypothetical protein
MLCKRVDNLKSKLRVKPKTNKIDIQSRHKYLLSIEGWYEVDTDFTNLPKKYWKYLAEYNLAKTSLKFTRWLAKKEIDNDIISDIGKYLSSVSFKLSCRHKDLLRLAETKHYISCFNNWRGVQQLRYLADPDMCVIFVPDAAGKYRWRALARLISDPHNGKGFALCVYKAYGNANDQAIFKKLDSIIPVYCATIGRMARFNGSGITVVSASEINNKIITSHVWSDHWVYKNAELNKLIMNASKWRIDNDIPF